MAKLPELNIDPTLEAMDKQLEYEQSLEKDRNYLGASVIGEECRRKLFYSFRLAEKRIISASGIKSIQDGYLQEEVTIKRLRSLPFIELHNDDGEGKQIGFEMMGFLRGHIDGMIKGLIQAPQTWHVFEHKCVNDLKFSKMLKAKEEKGEKNALKEWDDIYYAQAQLYMHSFNIERHYTVVSAPGGRTHTSCRTEYNRKDAEALIEKAKSIIFDGDLLPARISDRREYFRCGWCEYKELCHDGKMPQVNCRTCRYCDPDMQLKEFNCLKHNKILKNFEACPDHVYNPALIQARLIKHEPDGCIYQLETGEKLANITVTGMPEMDNDKIDFIYTSEQLRNDIVFLANLKEVVLDAADSVAKAFSGTKEWQGKKDSRLKDI